MFRSHPIIVAALGFGLSSAASAEPFTCEIQGDGKSVRAAIANPYKQDAHCSVDCEFSTTKAGTVFTVSCAASVAAGGAAAQLCVKAFEGGSLVKMTEGRGECTNPEPPAEDADGDAEVDAEKLADPKAMREHIRKQLPPEGQRALDGMSKP